MIFDYAAQPKESVRECNLCSGDHFEDFAHRDRYGLPVESKKCCRCGLVFLSPRMTAAGYREFYRSGAYRELVSTYHGREINAETIEAEQAIYAAKLAEYLRWDLEGKAVYHMLDVGGSTGVVASRLCKQYNLDGVVVEPSEAEAKHASARGLTVVLGTIEEYEPEREFELIIMCQTVDHLLDIRGSLAKIHSALRPGGTFFVDIVDYFVPLSNGREKATKVDHPFYLSPSTMTRYLLGAGFKGWGKFGDPDGLHINYVCVA